MRFSVLAKFLCGFAVLDDFFFGFAVSNTPQCPPPQVVSEVVFFVKYITPVHVIILQSGNVYRKGAITRLTREHRKLLRMKNDLLMNISWQHPERR